MPTRNDKLICSDFKCPHCSSETAMITEGEMLEYSGTVEYEALWVSYTYTRCSACGEETFSN